MSETLSQLIRNTKEYSNVCDMCKDGILIYPIMSGRTKYTQDEVEQIMLKRIIDKFQIKEQECEELKDKLKFHEKMITTPEFTVALTDMRTGERDIREQYDKGLIEENTRYRKALEEIENSLKGYCKHMCMAETKETCNSCQFTAIFDIINKAKISNIISKMNSRNNDNRLL